MNKSIISREVFFSIALKYFISFCLVLVLFLISAQVNAQSYRTKSKGRLVKKDGVSAYIVRDDMSKALKLTMLVAHKSSFSKRVVKMVGHNVVPLTFSVSTAPNISIDFNPKKIQFTQNGKTWQADSLAFKEAVIQLNADEPFGGLMSSGDTHQAVFLLPGWFDINAPLYVHYDDEVKHIPVASAATE